MMIVIILIPLLLAVAFHEAAHAWMAYKLGDNTAYLQGRVTLNPLKHFDWVGSLIFPVALWFLSNQTFTLGWARPVPFNPHKLRNDRLDPALVAFAGPLANIIMAVMWIAILLIILIINQALAATSYPLEILDPESSFSALSIILLLCGMGMFINLFLALFNLLPIPPLDGGHIVAAMMPPSWKQQFMKIAPFGIFIIIGLLVTGILPIELVFEQVARLFFALLSFFY